MIRSPRRQRGATAVTVAVFLFAALSALLTAIDVGRVYFAQRDLQRLANLAALDATRAISGCRGPVTDPQAEAEAAAAASIAANGGGESLLENPDAAIELGIIDRTAGVRRFVPASEDEAVAVNVRLTETAPRRLLPLYSSGAGTLRVESVAFSAPLVGLSLGNSLASLDVGESALLSGLLGALLGAPDAVNLDAAGFSGLANAQVTLQDLLDAGLVGGDVDDLLNTRVSAPAFLSALADALNDVDDAAAGLVADLAAVADPARDFLPGDVLIVEDGLESVAAILPVNAADLLMAVAQAAAEGAPVTLPVAINVPGVAAGELNLRVIEPAQIVFDRPGYDSSGRPRAEAHSAQALAQLDLQLTPVNLSVPPLLSANLAANLHLFLVLAEARANVDRLNCATLGRPFHTVAVNADNDAASLGLGMFDDLAAADPAPQASPPLVDANIGVVGLPPIRLVVTADAGPVDVGDSGNRELLFDGPFVPQIDAPSADNRRTLGLAVGGALSNGLDDLANSLDLKVDVDAPAVGPVLQPLLDSVVAALQGATVPAVRDAVTPVLAGLDTLLDPTLQLLGLNVGAVDLTVTAVQVSAPDPFGDGRRPYVELVTH